MLNTNTTKNRFKAFPWLRADGRKNEYQGLDDEDELDDGSFDRLKKAMDELEPDFDDDVFDHPDFDEDDEDLV